jgi:hypothetical protein
VFNEVYKVIIGKPGHPDQSPCINCWQDAVLSPSTWLRPCLEETCRIMQVRVATTSKSREKTKEPILAKKPKETPPPYVALYPPLPPVSSSAPSPPTSDEGIQGTVTPVKSGPEASGSSSPLTSLSPMDLTSTLSPPVLTLHPLLNRGHSTSLHEDPSCPQTPTAMQMPQREVQGLMYSGW